MRDALDNRALREAYPFFSLKSALVGYRGVHQTILRYDSHSIS